MTGFYRTHGKRLLDLMIAIPALIVLLPVIVVIACLVRIYLGSPVVFRQRRPGHLGHPFWIFKFRTMNNDCDASGTLLSDDARLTRFGRFLRASSLDELPGLLNVVKGDMSLVGPRPLLVEYLDLYTPEQARRHEVLPGMTGWAQVNGRNAIDWDTKFELDVWYVESSSLWLDLSILLKTIAKVIRRDDINTEGQATTTPFTGAKKNPVTDLRSAA